MIRIVCMYYQYTAYYFMISYVYICDISFNFFSNPKTLTRCRATCWSETRLLVQDYLRNIGNDNPLDRLEIGGLQKGFKSYVASSLVLSLTSMQTLFNDAMQRHNDKAAALNAQCAFWHLVFGWFRVLGSIKLGGHSTISFCWLEQMCVYLCKGMMRAIRTHTLHTCDHVSKCLNSDSMMSFKRIIQPFSPRLEDHPSLQVVSNPHL